MRLVVPRGSAVNAFYGKARELHGRLVVQGMQISVENAVGTLRHWHDPHGKESGSTRMLYAYGYIRGTEGTDGDHVDCYVGPNHEAPNVYIVTQMKKPDFTEVDEQKVMIGFDSAKKAKRAYLAHYNDPRFYGSMKKMGVERFKKTVLDKENHGELVKALFIGPRGGKWMDAAHTIPWSAEADRPRTGTVRIKEQEIRNAIDWMVSDFETDGKVRDRTDDHVGTYTFEYDDARGNKMRVPITMRVTGSASKDPRGVTGALVTSVSNGWTVAREVNLRFAASWAGKPAADLKRALRDVLSHELTHGADVGLTLAEERRSLPLKTPISKNARNRARRKQRASIAADDSGTDGMVKYVKYLNLPHEVTASIKQITRDILDKPVVAELLRDQMAHARFPESPRPDRVEELLALYSPRWDRVGEHYTEENKKRVYRAVASLRDAILEGRVEGIEKAVPITLADLVKAAKPAGGGWTPIPGGHRGGFRRRKGDGWEYSYPDGTAEHRVSEHEPKSWKTAAQFTEHDFESGDYDKDATHWHWRKTDGDLKAWVVGGVDPASKAPVKVGGAFAKLYQITQAVDEKNPNYAILTDVSSGKKIMMQHDRIFAVDHDPLRRARVRLPEVVRTTQGEKWTPGGGPKPTVSSGRAGASARHARSFEGSTASKEKKPGLYAIENGVYPMSSVERWETSEDGTRSKVKKQIIAVPDHGKNLLVKEFEGMIANQSRNVMKQFALVAQYESAGRGLRAVNTTLAELQRGGVEGLLSAIEDYDAEHAFVPHAQQYVRDHIRLAAARERLGGISLPARHQRNIGRYIAARAQAAKDLGITDPSPEEVMPYFKLLKQHIHPHLTGAQAKEPVPTTGYKITAATPAASGATVRATGEKTGESNAGKERDTVLHPGKLEWANRFHGFLAGQSGANDLFEDDKYALPGMSMGVGFSPEERVSIRQSVTRALESLKDFEFTTKGRQPTTYKGDAGAMLALHLGLSGDEQSVREIAAQVPIYANGKKLQARRAETIVAEMLEHAVEHAREVTVGRDAKRLMERAEERIVTPAPAVQGPSWHEIIRARAAAVTAPQIAAYREEESARLSTLVARSHERLAMASEADKPMHENSLHAAEEALRRVSRIDEAEIRSKIAQRVSPETAEMRKLMTQTIDVEMPSSREFEYSNATMLLTDPTTGAQRRVKVRSMKDLRDNEERGVQKSDRKQPDATLTSGMLREAINYPRTMRLLVDPDDAVASAPTIARRTLELLTGVS